MPATVGKSAAGAADGTLPHAPPTGPVEHVFDCHE
jgi:hypothetical protein